jgi:hypothetical protein
MGAGIDGKRHTECYNRVIYGEKVAQGFGLNSF